MRKFVLFIIIFVSLAATAGKHRHDIPVRPYENSHFATIDSLRIHYRTWNDGLASPRGNVLLIHGFCGSTFSWRCNYNALISAGYRVVAIDLPGFGYSARSVKVNQSQSNRGRIIWELIKAIDPSGATSWNVVGHSMGGGTAEAVALMNPARTKSLTIVDGMVFIKNDNVSLNLVGLVNHPLYNKMLLDYAENSYLTFNNLRRELKGTYGFMPDTVLTNGYLEPLLIDGTAETVVNLIANSKEIQPLDAHHLNGIPLQIIWGRKDRTIRLSQGKKLKRAVPSAELNVIPDARHMPMETHSEEFNRLLVGFLDRNNK